ncbi:zf-HC2 domain-containing protein [Rodentibacter pneumotropicus]|uniref:Zf-HC2 domain-containing protein n=2 Tax=Rodentibacter pneumotropicus TaxID=758 RepID=A0A1V3K5X0_9PAST|nr:zf-HC2 domain-containing protein [Rodentibacter pneumotropicus]MDC2825596.1 zf-HC2 domain-containing protein [Rodentibacter pneumotropicus]NBH75099.1 zf-HC2 domain-containing protein [Rodentibacter pneumotropicus]OOF60665.1 dsDNA-mimic protein [Rodentibacter pneumotropicus]OOF62779.1 dsDNA-mimic protein [Rodentibacter pneumotropicus]OOF68007.1 dsDNA-mimic protein [Rodentibacter pneumotropicus]
MNCLQVTKLISDSQERPLSFLEKTGMNAHLLICPHCVNFNQNVQQIRKMMKTFSKY